MNLQQRLRVKGGGGDGMGEEEGRQGPCLGNTEPILPKLEGPNMESPNTSLAQAAGLEGEGMKGGTTAVVHKAAKAVNLFLYLTLKPALGPDPITRPYL